MYHLKSIKTNQETTNIHQKLLQLLLEFLKPLVAFLTTAPVPDVRTSVSAEVASDRVGPAPTGLSLLSLPLFLVESLSDVVILKQKCH